MIGTIRRHQKWLWGVIIIATIFSFVYYLSPSSRYSGGQGYGDSSNPNLGSINGEPIRGEELRGAEREARLFYFVNTGTWPSTESQKKQVMQIAEQSLVIQSILKDYKITATTDAAARFIKQMFRIPAGQSMPVEKLNEWVQRELMAKGGLTMEDLDRFARHQAAQEYLLTMFGMSGKLITPKEAEFSYRRENEPMVTEIVLFPTASFQAAATPTEAELQDYFTKHEADYRLPDRVEVNYVAFDPSNYTAKADQLLGTNLDEKADEFYRQQGPEAFKDESSGQTLDSTTAVAKIKSQMRLAAAIGEARKDAGAFLNALSEGRDASHPYTPSDLEKLAKSRGLTVKATGPFDEKNGCKDMDLPPKPLHALFSLRSDAPDDEEKAMLYTPSPLVGRTAVYVAGLRKRMPSQLQTLAAVREQVVNDCREAKAIALSKEAGDKFAGALQAGLMQGQTFDTVCAAQNVKPESLAPFALTATNAPSGLDKLSFQQLQQAVFPLPAGQGSKYIPTTEGGLVAYVKGRLAVDESRMRQELPGYLAHMRQQRQYAAFSEWLNRQIQTRLIPPPGEQGGAG